MNALTVYDLGWRGVQCLSSYAFPHYLSHHLDLSTFLKLSDLAPHNFLTEKKFSTYAYALFSSESHTRHPPSLLRDSMNMLHLLTVCFSICLDEEENDDQANALQKLPLPVKIMILVGLTGVFTYIFYEKLHPQIDVSHLSSEGFHVSGYKSYGEIAQTALIFARVILTFYRSYTQGDYTKNLLCIALDLFTLYQISHCHMLEIKRTFSNPLTLFSESAQNFGSTIKQIDAHFYCVVPPSHIESTVKSIHDYSLHMFDGSNWNKNWSLPDAQELPWHFNLPIYYDYFLDYSIRLKKTPLCSSFLIKILHEGEVWTSFKAVHIFKIIPTFFNEGKYIPLKTWITADVS